MRRAVPFRVMASGRGIEDATGEPVLWAQGFSVDAFGEEMDLLRLFAEAPALLALARYAAERGEGDAEMAREILARLDAPAS